MSQDRAFSPAHEEERALDPNVSQRNASHPAYSVWVAASAGTGKTKVLTDRVLRLLLPREDGLAGTLPHRILCLTFTKAAASEMALRINDTLGEWSVLPEQELRKKLEKLIGNAATEVQVIAARKLFAQVVDTPGGLKIMTIHSFCQSVLGRFPLEAGLPPYFEMMDEPQSRDMIAHAQKKVLLEARKNSENAEGIALAAMATIQNENQFMDLLQTICSERAQLQKWLTDNDIDSVYELLGLSPAETATGIIDAFFTAMPRAELYEAVSVLSESDKATEQKKALGLKAALECDGADIEKTFSDYNTIFLTTKDEPRAKLLLKSTLDTAPHVEAIMETECQRALEAVDQLKALDCAYYTKQLIILGRAILEEYEQAKHRAALLDYDDLILKTRDLLEKGADWVMYKLDGGLSHILIDEAQDTNPEQWQIIKLLSGEFFSGENRHEETRTIFTVGDEKQSIYSFQRAAPQEFARNQKYFESTVKQAQEQWRDEALNISFRSTRTVLDLVDRTFEPGHIRKGLGDIPLKHESFRRGQAGLVELWPPFESAPTEDEPPWAPPVIIKEQKSGTAQLADYIGETVANWLKNGERLDSCGRAMKAGDIMILVRTRTAFVGQIMRALKTRNVPVSGVDRMVLGEQIAIMDMKAAVQFALLPEDDLTLACLLKSPLIGLPEEQLFDLAHGRKGSLWDSLQKSDCKNIVTYLKQLISLSAENGPYEFLSAIINTPCPADKISGLRAITRRLGADAHDPLDEFLNTALAYEQDGISSLQAFLTALEQHDVTIKREMEEAGNAVRIMTVHGSKGLQAPVVILPDSFTTNAAISNKLPKLLWMDKSELPAPLFAPASEQAPQLYLQARANVAERLDEEYRRLLYVAMTRAEDRLYIGGHRGKQPPRDDSWYNYIEKAFLAHDEADEFIFCEPQDENEEALMGLRIYEPQSKEPDRKAKNSSEGDAADKNTEMPGWLYKSAPSEPEPPRPLIPSRPSDMEPASHSPLSKDDPYRFKRGNITHMLLQILPDLPPEKRRRAAAQYLAKPALDLPQPMQESISAETFAILEHPDLAALFGAGSMAEVPLTGLIDGKLVSAQIDRLLITEDQIHIVDYKTNRPPPRKPEDIPQIYINQMSSYRGIVSTIYDCNDIRCYLLWTDGPNIMEVPL